jgi:uncharacterized protein YjbI with pentapeptide repeats
MSNMMIEIKSRWTGAVLYSGEALSLGELLINAVKDLANLRGANLRGANLRGANLTEADLRGADLTGADLTEADLRGADLTGADLRGANLRGANLTKADLTGADLTGADLRGANLRGANLTKADLTGADLRGASLTEADLTEADLTGANLRGASLTEADLTEADLTGANLRGANLRGANLRGADLRVCRDDFWAVLCSAPREAFALRQALIDGKVDGSTYSGECACLVGTLAKARHCSYDAIPGLRPDGGGPAERFFLAIRKGDTPETNQASKLALEWTDEWIANMRSAFTTPTEASSK